jgi:hypothetical protein
MKFADTIKKRSRAERAGRSRVSYQSQLHPVEVVEKVVKKGKRTTWRERRLPASKLSLSFSSI